jgi:replicative DNA helicase
VEYLIDSRQAILVNVREYAEPALIGALLLSPGQVVNPDVWPPASTFFASEHERLYRQIMLAIESGTAPEASGREELAVAWSQRLRGDGARGAEIRIATLTNLMDACPRADNARSYAYIVVEAHVMRVIGQWAARLADSYQNGRQQEEVALWKPVADMLEGVSDLAQLWAGTINTLAATKHDGEPGAAGAVSRDNAARTAAERRVLIEEQFIAAVLHQKTLDVDTLKRVSPQVFTAPGRKQLYSMILSLTRDGSFSLQVLSRLARDRGLLDSPEDLMARYRRYGGLSPEFFAIALRGLDSRSQLERRLVAGLITGPDGVDELLSRLTTHDFITPNLDQIFMALVNLRRRGHAVDQVTTAAELQRMGIAGRGGVAIDDIMSLRSTDGGKELEAYVESLIDRSAELSYIETVAEIAVAGRNPAGTPEAMISFVNDRLKRLLDTHQDREAAKPRSETKQYSIAEQEQSGSSSRRSSV